jgi:arylsulfatase A-like enzyme
MIRRPFILAVVSLLIHAASAHAAAPPNIVMIISDDHLWKDYGFMGHPVAKTPHLDKLAGESLTFTRGYVPSSLCCPSLVTIITGLYPHQNKITSNDPPVTPGAKGKGKSRQMSAEFDAGREIMSKHLENAGTLTSRLGKAGYLSLQTGKWWQKHFSRGGFTHGMTEGGRHGDKGLDIGRVTMQPIYDFISEAQEKQKPFLVWYAPLLPHDPHTPPERLLAKYRDKVPSLHVAKYYAMVEWFDETCGQLLDHLDAKGLRENTIVVYVTDNGWITNPDVGKYAAKSKQSQYDGGVRTPIMIRWPGKVKPKMSLDLASSIDITPTLMKAAGLEPTKEMQGINLLDDAAVSARKTIFGECFTHNSMNLDVPAASLKWRWVIDGHMKLIIPDKKNQPDDVIELYDLKADPDEEHNQAEAEMETVHALTKKLDDWWRP